MRLQGPRSWVPQFVNISESKLLTMNVLNTEVSDGDRPYKTDLTRDKKLLSLNLYSFGRLTSDKSIYLNIDVNRRNARGKLNSFSSLIASLDSWHHKNCK